jgi:hypothetical protein
VLSNGDVAIVPASLAADAGDVLGAASSCHRTARSGSLDSIEKNLADNDAVYDLTEMGSFDEKVR